MTHTLWGREDGQPRVHRAQPSRSVHSGQCHSERVLGGWELPLQSMASTLVVIALERSLRTKPVGLEDGCSKQNIKQGETSNLHVVADQMSWIGFAAFADDDPVMITRCCVSGISRSHNAGLLQKSLTLLRSKSL